MFIASQIKNVYKWTEDGVLLEPGKDRTVGIEAIKAYMEEQKEASRAYEIKKYKHKDP